eukprot:11222120-Lingulodinium_polyedra.AAC.1
MLRLGFAGVFVAYRIVSRCVSKPAFRYASVLPFAFRRAVKARSCWSGWGGGLAAQGVDKAAV